MTRKLFRNFKFKTPTYREKTIKKVFMHLQCNVLRAEIYVHRKSRTKICFSEKIFKKIIVGKLV